MRYRDQNSEDMTEFGQTNTVKRMMEVSEATKPSIRILNLNHTIYDVVPFLPQHNHIPSVFCTSRKTNTSRSAIIKPLNIFFFLRNKPIGQRKCIQVRSLKFCCHSFDYIQQRRDQEIRRNICLSARELDCERELQDQ